MQGPDKIRVEVVRTNGHPRRILRKGQSAPGYHEEVEYVRVDDAVVVDHNPPPDFGGIQVVGQPADRKPSARAAALNGARKARARTESEWDEVVVLLPKGRWKEARDAIWKALGSAPLPRPESDAEVMLAHPDNLRRMMEGGAYGDSASTDGEEPN
jgi:hypothetical protein